MIIYNNSDFSIYFGTAQDNLYQDDYLALAGISAHTLLQHPLFVGIKGAVKDIPALVFLRQVHGVQGESIDTYDVRFGSFAIEGDFLTTNQSHIGLGIMTADCVPIIFYDPLNHARAIVHAGWRGTVANIVLIALARMQERYGTNPNRMNVFFGPSAQSCCYEVTADFVDNNVRSDLIHDVIVHRGNALFFDVQRYNKLLLIEHGVPDYAFNHAYVRCTICDDSFFSYRRQGVSAGRQATIVF